MLTLEHNSLVFDFSDVHPAARLSVELERTLRVPDDGREYPLPPGLGAFPLRHLEDYAGRLPAEQVRRGGVIMPMYQAEAAWLLFSCEGRPAYPFAVKVAAGKIDAVTGEPLVNGLAAEPQNYLVAPDQPWLDGFRTAAGHVGQFVAMPLGQGYTVEEQLTGTAKWGGLQIVVYPMKAERYEELKRKYFESRLAFSDFGSGGLGEPPPMFCDTIMGLGRGGKIRQKIVQDEYGLDAWDQARSHRCFVTVLNSKAWRRVTGETPPHQPPSAQAYTKAGLPWFEYYDDKLGITAPAPILGKVKTVAQVAAESGQEEIDFGESAAPIAIVGLTPESRRPIREYDDRADADHTRH